MTSATSGDRKKFALPAESYRNTVSALKDDWQLYIPYGPLEKDRFPGDRRDSFQFFFDGQKLNEDDLIENIHSTRDKPIILHRPVYQVPCHDTHITALPLEIVHDHILSILEKRDRVAFACTNSHFDGIYKSSPTCDMSRTRSPLTGDKLLIDAVRTGQSLRIVNHLMTTRSEMTATGKHAALLLALCTKRDPAIVHVLLNLDSARDVVDMRHDYMNAIRPHLPQRLMYATVRLRELVEVLAAKSDVQHMLEPYLNAWSSDPLRSDEQDECSICMESHASYTRLNCQHFFGSECIDSWRTTSSTGCPLCRRPF